MKTKLNATAKSQAEMPHEPTGELSVRVKICGLTRLEDALLASRLGAWAVGFIFYDKSPRFVSPEKAAPILAALEQNPRLTSREVRRVGIFVNAPLEFILRTQESLRLTAVQLHGDETPSFCEAAKVRLGETWVVKALRPRDDKASEHGLTTINSYRACDAILIDSFSKDLYGGTGQTAAWSMASLAARSLEREQKPLILSGGLNVGNVGEAVKTVRPYAVDVSSGLEEKPGVKSHLKMQEFFDVLRSLS